MRIQTIILNIAISQALFQILPFELARLATGIQIGILMLSTFFPRLRFYVRLSSFLAGLLTTAAWGVFTSLFMGIIGRRSDAFWVVARSFYNLVGPVVGVRFTISGAEHLDKSAHPAVIVGNHQSIFDILYLGAIFPKQCSIMAKKELKWSPFLGQFMVLANAVWVDRSNRQSALSTFAKVAEVMKSKGTSLFLFPEGTRFSSKTPTLLPFKKGAFHLAVAGQVPIIPIVVEPYWKIYSLPEKRFESGEIQIRVLPPISTTGYTSAHDDIAKLSDEVRNRMLDAMEEMVKDPNTVAGDREVLRDGEAALALYKPKKKSA